MPIYEYECESCCIRFERLQHFSDEPVKECPECGGAVHRVLQPVGIIFKGKGFYSTDHRQSSATSPATKAPGAPKESGDKAATAPATEASKPANEATDTKGGASAAPSSTAKEATA